jgi:hypothetical protein
MASVLQCICSVGHADDVHDSDDSPTCEQKPGEYGHPQMFERGSWGHVTKEKSWHSNLSLELSFQI